MPSQMLSLGHHGMHAAAQPHSSSRDIGYTGMTELLCCVVISQARPCAVSETEKPNFRPQALARRPRTSIGFGSGFPVSGKAQGRV
jgi:hypothetical protein